MGQDIPVFRQHKKPAEVKIHLDQDTSQHVSMSGDDELFIRKAMMEDPHLGVELLYKRYYQPLCTHTIRFVGSRQAAEDLVSEVFYQFYSEGVFSQITTSYGACLVKTVQTRAYNSLRWELNRKSALEAAPPISVKEYYHPDAITQYEELWQDVEKAINTLPVARRKIYLLYHFEGMKLRDIADTLQISVRTVEAHVYRAGQVVRKLLKDKWLLATILAFLG